MPKPKPKPKPKLAEHEGPGLRVPVTQKWHFKTPSLKEHTWSRERGPAPRPAGEASAPRGTGRLRERRKGKGRLRFATARSLQAAMLDAQAGNADGESVGKVVGSSRHICYHTGRCPDWFGGAPGNRGECGRAGNRERRAQPGFSGAKKYKRRSLGRLFSSSDRTCMQFLGQFLGPLLLLFSGLGLSSWIPPRAHIEGKRTRATETSQAGSP